MSFDWQTEEDGDWDDSDLTTSFPDKQKPADGRRWLRGLLLLGVLSLALAAAGWTLNRRVQLGTERVEAEILASVNLVNQATAQQDKDLALAVLSGRDGRWSSWVLGQVERGTLTERGGLGLLSLPVTAAVTPTIEITADLLEAEVTTMRPYAIEVGNGLTETVQLEQTAVYRKGPNRWLLSPPALSFWGDIRQLEGQYINLFYPDRDKDIAQELLLSLDAKIGQICTQLSDFECPPGYQIVLELSTDPATFTQMTLTAAAAAAQQRHLTVPTPTLVGLPRDQVGEKALFRGYGQLVAASVLTDLWLYDCCDDTHSLLYFALLRDTLRQVGLMPWPDAVGAAATPLDYDLLFAKGLPSLFADLSFWYQMEDGTLTMPDKQDDILIAFVQKELGLAASDIIFSLGRSRFGQSFGEWLQEVAGNGESAQALDNAWRSFIYERTSLAQQAPPVPLPEQEIQLLCQMAGEERMALYRYDLAADTTILEQPLNRSADKMVALPDDNGLAIWEKPEANAATVNLYLWQNGQITEISWDAVDSVAGSVPFHADPSNSQLILLPSNTEQTIYGLLDVASCLGDDCLLETLEGYPVWSPDRAHMIMVTPSFVPSETHQYGRLMLADGAGELIRIFAFGASPFWLDDATFAFVSDEGEGSKHTVVTGQVNEEGYDWEVLLTVDQLTAVLNDSRTHWLDFVAPHPHEPDTLVIVTTTAEDNERTLFIYDWVMEELLLAQPFSDSNASGESYRFSPNGRFLLAQYFEVDPNLQTQNGVYIIDLLDGETSVKALQPFVNSSIYWHTDFSEEGDWLLTADEQILYLSLPGTDYERLIFPETGPCKTAVFVDKKT